MPIDITPLMLRDKAIELMLGRDKFRHLSRNKKLIVAYCHLEGLRQLNGGYIASPYTGAKGGDRYDLFWLRDIMYATYANEYIGAYDKMIESYRLLLRIFHKYHDKITEGARNRHYMGSCASEVIHARVHPVTLEEITDDWGHHQLDIFGLFLYKTGDLIKKGHNPITTDRLNTLILLRDIVIYLTTVRWYNDPDFGVWEEGPERHSSSMAAVLAGLTMWHDDGYYDYKYKVKRKIHTLLPVPEEFLEKGRGALLDILPRESESRPCDLAQLSLIWPYNIVSEEHAYNIIENIENNLLRERGVARYPGDLYNNSDKLNPEGNEAQWPLGLAWLSIVYSKLAFRLIDGGGLFSNASHLIEKAHAYLDRLESVMTEDGRVPELYKGEEYGHNIPLAWAQSLYIVALQSLNSVDEKMRCL